MSDYKVLFGNINDKFIQEEWNNLSKSISNITFYQEYQWIHACIASKLFDFECLKLVIISKNDQVIAICPLQYEIIKRFGVNIYLWKIFWSNDMGVNDFVFAQLPENCNILEILINFLNQQEDFLWHKLEFENVPVNSSIAYSLNHYPLSRHIKVYQHDSKYIRCYETYEQTVSRLSTKFKRNNRRKLRKLQKLGTISYDYACDIKELEISFEDFLSVEASNWKGVQKTALLYDDSRRKFYRFLLKEFSTTEQCIIHTMRLDNKPIASQFALISGDTLNLMKIGYDVKYQSMGPGGLILDEILRKFSGHPTIKKVSFVTGAKWNDIWKPDITKVNRHTLFNSNFFGTAFYGIQILINYLRKFKSR